MRARSTDPATSHAAAASMAVGASAQRAQVLSALRALGQASATRIAERAGLTQVQVCRRLPELLDSGAVEVVPMALAYTASRRPERVWRPASL